VPDSKGNGACFDLRYAEKPFGPLERFHTDSRLEGTGVGPGHGVPILRGQSGPRQSPLTQANEWVAFPE